jgi:hypothetical protein
MTKSNPNFAWLMVEPINGGTTYQITTTEETGFVVLAETPIDLDPDMAKKYAQLLASSSMMFEVLTDLEALISGFHAVKQIKAWAAEENVVTQTTALEKIRAAIAISQGL